MSPRPAPKTFLEVYEACGQTLTSRDPELRMSVLSTFFWTQVNKLDATELRREGLPLPLKRVAVTTPQTYIFDSEGPLLITIRGTNFAVPKDVLVDFTGRLPRVILKPKTRDKLVQSTPRVRSLIEAWLESMRRSHGHVTVQAGLFLYAVRCLVQVVRALKAMSVSRTSGRAIHLYGHSMGAACASFLYVWMSDLGYDVTCSCMSCPRLTNIAGYDRWCARHDNQRYRHYYTRGDPVVHGLPKAAGLTRHVSMTYYVAPLVELEGASVLLSPLIAHVTFQPHRFRRYIKKHNKHGERSESEKQPRSAVGKSLAVGGPPCFRDNNVVLTSTATTWALSWVREETVLAGRRRVGGLAR